MTKKIMYKGKVNSPEALLSEQVTAAQTDIKVTDASVFPPGPNLAVIGVSADAETILYSGINNNILVGCTRGFQGVAKTWDANSPIARNITEYDIGSLQENVDELYTVKLEADSDLKTNKVAFVQATSRANIGTGETLATLFGKIMKFFADLKLVAFTGKASDLETDVNNLLVTNAEKIKWNDKYDVNTEFVVEELNKTGNILTIFKDIGTKITNILTKLVPEGGTTGQVLKKTAAGYGWGTDDNTTYTAGTNVSITDNQISATDTKYTAGTNVTISGTTISATDTTYGLASSSDNGLMPSAMFTKLNGLYNMVYISESAFTALSTKDPNMLYLRY